MDDAKRPEPTERVVLIRVERANQTLPREQGSTASTRAAYAWIPIVDVTTGETRIFRAASKRQAIEQYAGKKGKDHPGTYRAPSLRSWREEHTFKPSDEPTMIEEIAP